MMLICYIYSHCLYNIVLLLTGAPPLRPLWVAFPEDEGGFAVDNEHLIGSSLLVRPVTEEGATSATVYFPPGVWYDVIDWTIQQGPATRTVAAPREKVNFSLGIELKS